MLGGSYSTPTSFDYAAGVEPCDLDPATMMCFSFISSQIKRDAEKHEEICQKRAEAGKMGGRPPKSKDKQIETQKANGFFENLNNPDNVYEDDKEDDKEDEKNINYQLIADMYNDVCTSFPKVKKLSVSRKKAIKARLNSGYTVDDFKRLFELAEASSFLKGGNNRNWAANFDWLIADANMTKVLDGNYSDRRKGGGPDAGNQGRGSAADYYEKFMRSGNSNDGEKS